MSSETHPTVCGTIDAGAGSAFPHRATFACLKLSLDTGVAVVDAVDVADSGGGGLWEGRDPAQPCDGG